MIIKKEFVKFQGRYHLLTMEDVEYLQKHGKWPKGYKQINWDEEDFNFASIQEFLGDKLPDYRAYNIGFFASKFDIPVRKRKTYTKLYPEVNTYPRYWLEEMLG
jgi:hypothetical protein